MIAAIDIGKLKDKSSLDRFVQERCEGDIDRFISELNATINNLLRTDLKQAERLVEKLALLFCHLPDKYEARLLAIKARCSQWTGEYRDAITRYESALKINQRFRDFKANARIRKGLMNVYLHLGRYQQALKAGQQALRYFRRKNMSTDTAEILANIGSVYHRMDNNPMAMRYYSKSKEIFRRLGGVGLAIVEYNLANIYANMNRLGEARKLYRDSAELYSKLGLDIARCQAEYSLAYLYFLENRFTEALNQLESAYESFVTLGDRKSAATALLDLIEINTELNHYGTAITFSESGIPLMHELGMVYEEAKARYFVSRAWAKSGEYKQARDELKNSARLFEREKNNLWLGMVHVAWARLLLAEGKHRQGREESNIARSYFRKCGDSRRETDAEIVRLEGFLSSRDTAQALKLASALRHKKLLEYQRHELFSLMGKCYFQRGDYVAALKWFKSAVKAIEEMLQGLYDDEIRFFFVADKLESYLLVVKCLIESGRIQDSFLANLRALEVINHRRVARYELGSRIPENLISQRELLRTTLQRYYRTTGEAYRKATPLADVRSAEQQLWSLERKVRAEATRILVKREATVESFESVSKALKANEMLVNYFSVGSTVAAYCATGSKVNYVELPVRAGQLRTSIHKLNFVCENAVFGLRESCGMAPAASRYLRELYYWLVEPIEDITRAKDLIIIADGDFCQVPFNALISRDGRFVKDLCRVHLIVNPVQILHRDHVNGPFSHKKNAVFAVTSDTLPSMKAEARDIKSAFKSASFYLDSSAYRTNLVSELRSSNGFVHIAAHASRSSENPLFSKILMADGPFFPFNLFQTGVTATLVTLSGCQTAAPGLYYGNSFSLAKAFYQAGSRYVLGSLWPVSDKLSRLFMKQFYSSLADRQNIHESFRNALDTLIKATDNPALWGSFVLLGI